MMNSNNIVEQQIDENGNLIVVEDTKAEIDNVVARIQTELAKTPEVENISRQIDIRDNNTILEFGAGPASEIASFSDKILKRVQRSEVEDSAEMLTQLAKLMKSFDPKDFEEEKLGFFSKMFKNTKKMLEKLLAKYQTIGGEVDKIFTEVTKYKKDIGQTNNILENLYEENFRYYESLEKHVIAGNMISNHIKENELPSLQQKAQEGSQMDAVSLDTLNNSLDILDQRIYDLEMGKMVALQAAPQIRLIQKGNYKLLCKMQSAFVITIPIFKMGLIQAIALKKQKLVADSMDALDNATNEMLLRNAQNTASQSAQITRLSSGSVKLETLTETWNTILKGIDETKSIEEENKKQREEGTKSLHALQNSVIEKLKG